MAAEWAFRQGLDSGDIIDALDTDKKWCIAEIKRTTDEQVYVHCKALA